MDRLTQDLPILPAESSDKGARIPVTLILDPFRTGDTVEDLLRGPPTFTRDDLQAALADGALPARERIVPLARTS